MKKPLDPRRVLAALLCALLLSAPLAPVYAADIWEDPLQLSWEPTPEQPAILLHWVDGGGNYVSVPAAYQGMVNGMHAYWLQVTDPFVIENRLGSVAFTVTGQNEGDLFEPDPTVGINFAGQLDVPVLITNVTQMRSWILIVSTLPMPAPEYTPEPTPEPTEEPTQAPEPTPEPELTQAPTQAPEPTQEPEPTEAPTPEPELEPEPTPEPGPVLDTSFTGYARVPSAARLRSTAEINDGNIVVTIPASELVYADGKLAFPGPEHAWYRVSRITVDNTSGFMREDVLQFVPYEEALEILGLSETESAGEAAAPAEEISSATPATAEGSAGVAALNASFTDEPGAYNGYVLTLAPIDDPYGTVPLQTVPGENNPLSTTLSDMGADLILRVGGQMEIDGRLWYHVYSPFAPEYEGWVPADNLTRIDEAAAEPYLQARVTPPPTAGPPTEAPPQPTPEPPPEQATPTPEPVVTPTPSPEPTPRVEYPAPTQEGPVDRYGFTNNVGVNVRREPRQSANSADTLTKGTNVWIHELVVNTAGEQWYRVTAMRENGSRGNSGYIMASLVSLMNDQEQAAYIDAVSPNTPPTHEPTPSPTPSPTPTPAPITVPPETPPPTTPTPAPAPTPTPTARPQPVEGHYAHAIADNVPVRMNPNIHAAPTQDVLMRNDVVYVFTQVYDDEGRPWHLIQFNN
ncbi:MAG: procyclic acidic repetitive family protein, partial [Clostridia bacterium]|nr:procyclic acidic repetitive family protein [Clostridia bacterium]